LTPSQTVTVNYEIYVATPVITPNGGTYSEPVKVTMTCSTPGATIYYTTDNSEPTTSSTAYTGAITLIRTTTLKAKAFKSGCTASETASAKITIQKFCDYDYNDWGMKLNEELKLHKWTNKLNKVTLEFVGDVHRSSNVHAIHFAISIDKFTKYHWEMKFYDDSDTLLATKDSSGNVYGAFDEIIFNDTSKQVGYRTTIEIEFKEDIDMKLLGKYDPYMYDKTNDLTIHANTLQNMTAVDADGTDPSLAGKEVPLILVIHNLSWEPPAEHQPIWEKYDKYDDCVSNLMNLNHLVDPWWYALSEDWM
jgi:hypothetical protein